MILDKILVFQINMQELIQDVMYYYKFVSFSFTEYRIIPLARVLCLFASFTLGTFFIWLATNVILATGWWLR